MPRSRATRAIGFLVSRTIRTAPWRNSASNRRRVSGTALLIVHASTISGEPQIADRRPGQRVELGDEGRLVVHRRGEYVSRVLVLHEVEGGATLGGCRAWRVTTHSVRFSGASSGRTAGTPWTTTAPQSHPQPPHGAPARLCGTPCSTARVSPPPSAGWSRSAARSRRSANSRRPAARSAPAPPDPPAPNSTESTPPVESNPRHTRPIALQPTCTIV